MHRIRSNVDHSDFRFIELNEALAGYYVFVSANGTTVLLRSFAAKRFVLCLMFYYVFYFIFVTKNGKSALLLDCRANTSTCLFSIIFYHPPRILRNFYASLRTAHSYTYSCIGLFILLKDRSVYIFTLARSTSLLVLPSNLYKS